MAKLEIESRGKVEVYYEEEGAGEPLVMVGGLTATVEVWGKLRGLLTAKYRLVMPDNRGTGRTKAHQDDGDRAPARMAEDLLGLVDGLGLDSFHLMGGSYGGPCALLRVKHHQRIKSLIWRMLSFRRSEKVASLRGFARRALGRRAGCECEELRARHGERCFHPETIDERPDVGRFL